jgi:hypothetical protein
VNWAIVIGIDEYGEDEPTLRAAVYDAARFSRWVIEDGGVPADNVRRLLGRQRKGSGRRETQRAPTRDNVLKLINEVMAESGGVGDKLFFFFSGHGVTVNYANREESALVFPGIDENQPVQTLAVRSIVEFFETTQFLDQFFFIDACRSPLPTSDAEIGAWQIPRRRQPGQDPPQQFILYATSPGRTAEDAGWPNESSAFSKVLMSGLRGKGQAKAWSWDRSRYEVRWERLASYVVHEMEKKQNPSDTQHYPFQIPQDVGTRGVAGRDRDALLARPRAGEVRPVRLRLDLGDASSLEARVTVLDALGVAVADAERVTRRFHEFVLPPRTYAARVRTAEGKVGHLVPPIELYKKDVAEIVWLDEEEPAPIDRYTAGSITIDSLDPLAVADIRDETGRVIGVATHNDGCEAVPGFYRVRLVGPERDKIGTPNLVLLRPGDTISAPLPDPTADERSDQSPDPTVDAESAELARAFGGSATSHYVTPNALAKPAVWAQPSTVVSAGIGAALHGDRQALAGLGLDRPLEIASGESGVALFVVGDRKSRKSVNELQVRVWPAGEDLAEATEPLEATDAGVAAVVKRVEEPKPHWLSIGPPEKKPKPSVVALPLMKDRLAILIAEMNSDRMRLYQFHPLTQAVESTTPDWMRRLEHLQRQLLGGRLDGGEDIALNRRPDADEDIRVRLSAQAKSDPFGGCLIGYVLLRLGRQEWLGGLATAIIETAPTLSDGYILRGEFEAHRQNQDGSNQAFAEAVSVGVPAFAEGLTRLVEGLWASRFVHPRGALVRYIFQQHVRGSMWAAFTPRYEFKPGRLVITGADVGFEG